MFLTEEQKQKYLILNQCIGLSDFQVKQSDKSLSKNILFIGSCRLNPIINYCKLFNLFDFYDFYFIYIPEFHEKKVPIETINSIIKKSEIIICESVSNYKFLNTKKESPDNIFSIYDIDKKTKVIYISNLELCMYYFTLLSCRNKDFFKNRQDSLARLYKKLKNNNENNIIEVIDKHLFNQKFPLFYTINHPSGFLTALSFINMCHKLDIKVKTNTIIERYMFDPLRFSLQGNKTILTYWDKIIYNIGFCNSFSNNHVHPSLSQTQYKIDLDLERKNIIDYI
jgi:hypothetical protein